MPSAKMSAILSRSHMLILLVHREVVFDISTGHWHQGCRNQNLQISHNNAFVNNDNTNNDTNNDNKNDNNDMTIETIRKYT